MRAAADPAEPRYVEPRFERASVDEIRAHQLGAVQQLLAEVEATNPFYRELWRAHGLDLARVTSLEAFAALVPTVGKAEFLADQETSPPFGRRQETARRVAGAKLVSTTSGTSGRGQEVHLQTPREVEGMGRTYAYLYRWAGLEPGDELALAMPLTMLGGGRLEHEGAQAYGLSVLPIGNDDAARKIEVLRRFQPRGLIGITAYLGRLALALDGPPPAALSAVITGGEGAGFEWLLRLEERWDASVYDRYGSSQAGNDHAFTCEHGIGTLERPGMLHNIDPYVLTEVIDPDTGRHVAPGEIGELVVTILYRPDAPIVRCRMGDRAVYREGRSCACGRPFGGIEIASIGRADDMRKIKGVNVWPQTIDDLVFGHAQLADYQVELATADDGRELATLRVMPRPEVATDGLADELARAVEDRLGIRFAVELTPAGALQQDDWKAKRWHDCRAHRSGAGA